MCTKKVDSNSNKTRRKWSANGTCLSTRNYVVRENLWKCKQISMDVCVCARDDRSRLSVVYLIRFECAVVLASSCEKSCVHKYVYSKHRRRGKPLMLHRQTAMARFTFMYYFGSNQLMLCAQLGPWSFMAKHFFISYRFLLSISQIDRCIDSNYDAILWNTISEQNATRINNK